MRTEIEAALRGGGRVVPVLVDDAALPPRDALPRPFRPITSLNAVTPAPRLLGPGPRDAGRRPGRPGAGRDPGAGGRRRPRIRSMGAGARRPGPRTTTAGSRRRSRAGSWSRCSAPAFTRRRARGSGSRAAGAFRTPPSSPRALAGLLRAWSPDSTDLRGDRAAGPGGRGAQAAGTGPSRAPAQRRRRARAGPPRARAHPRPAARRGLRELSAPGHDDLRHGARARVRARQRAVRPGGLHRRREGIAGASCTSRGTTRRTARSSRSRVRTSTSSSRSTTTATCPGPSS